MERNLVKIVGEDDSLGKPYLYGIDAAVSGGVCVGSLDDLPMATEMRRPMSRTRVEEELAEDAGEAEATV